MLRGKFLTNFIGLEQNRLPNRPHARWHTCCSKPLIYNREKTMKAWSIVAVEISMALAGVAMIGLMIAVYFL